MNHAKSFEATVAKFPENVCLEFQGESYSYVEIEHRANQWANFITELGIKKGQCVALYLPNSPEFIWCYLAIAKVGAIAASISAIYQTREIEGILKNCQPTKILTLSDIASNIPSSYPRENILAVDAMESRVLNSKTTFSGVQCNADSPAAILYTSGTTGIAKGVTLSHKNIQFNSEQARKHCRIHPTSKLSLFLPLSHCFGQNFILNTAICTGSTVVLFSRYEPETVLDEIKQSKITHVFGVPPIFAQWLARPHAYGQWRSVQFFFSAGAKMPIETSSQWLEEIGLPIYEGYGLTETSPFATYNHPENYQLGNIGVPIDGVEIQVVDEGLSPLPSQALGEILIKGPNVMLGYWNNPGDTAEVLKDGWFRTGDIGYLDKRGNLHIVDRLKDMINSAGFKIYPSEVEAFLLDHPDICDAAVYAIADEEKGESVKASLVLKQGKTTTPKAIIEYCRKNMAGYKVPKVSNS